MPMCRLREAYTPTTATRQRTLNFRLRLNLIFQVGDAVPETANGFPNFKTPVETSTSPNYS